MAVSFAREATTIAHPRGQRQSREASFTPAARRSGVVRASVMNLRSGSGARLLDPRHDLLAEEPQRVHHALMRDQAAGIELRQDAVDAELIAQAQKPVGDALGG